MAAAASHTARAARTCCCAFRSARRYSTRTSGSSPTSRTRARASSSRAAAPAVAAVEWKGKKINLIDTPGFNIFINDTRGTLIAADAALVGLPNAGKSSLLARISNARPKIAEYPFTTLSPVLGTVESPDGRQLVVADVPGLIEGASEGIGLGHEFLAHLERAHLLLHTIDSSEGDADERWRTIDAELAAYGAGLDERPQVVVLNKIDLSPDPPAFGIEDERIVRVFRVSAATGAGIEELKRALFELVPLEETASLPPERHELVDYLVYRPQPARRSYRVFRTERGFRVTGRPPEPAELERILKAAGARDGDQVEMGDEVLEWQ